MPIRNLAATTEIDKAATRDRVSAFPGLWPLTAIVAGAAMIAVSLAIA